MKPEILYTLKLEDQGQDFTELDILENGIIKGYSILFADDRLTFLGAGSLDGKSYVPFECLDWNMTDHIMGGYVYFYETGKPKPLPWNASTFKYKIVGIKQPKKKSK